ncbi:hypothetical protein ACE1TF_10000 [Geomicrobium sp. JSM 1781026]|uniref:hypothetical protein n=1 Tax=Geomicrobium sp. JSM 1781026 TaxID=3344580 RepID=UPI0035C16781
MEQHHKLAKLINENYILLINEPIMKSFLEKKENFDLLHIFLDYPNSDTEITFNETFRNHFYKAKLSMYLSKSIYFKSVEFDKKVRRYLNHFPLIADKTAEKKEKNKYIDNINRNDVSVNSNHLDYHLLFRSNDILDHITCPNLYRLMKKFSERQLLVLSLLYVGNYTKKEVSILLRVSPQYISNTERHCFNKIKGGLK